MTKVNLLAKYCLINENYEYNIKGIYQNKKLTYFDNNCQMILDFKKNILIRITKELKIMFDFNNKICEILDIQNKNNIKFTIEVIILKQFLYRRG